MNLTKHQKHYRSKQKEARKDFKRTTGSTGKPAIHATKKKLCLRISDLAHNYLKDRAAAEGKTVTTVLEDMLINVLPNYNNNGSPNCFSTKRYSWRKCDSTSLKRKQGGTNQINVWVISTAWHKLDIAAEKTGRSKARVVEMMIREKF